MIALILGGAACLADDLLAFEAMRAQLEPATVVTVIAVNDAITVFPNTIDHAASLHPEKLLGWIAERARRGGNINITTWAHTDGCSDGGFRADRSLPIRYKQAGSSGLFAVQVAQKLNARRIILCGVPMDAQAHVGDAATATWSDAERYRPAWERWHSEGDLGDVRSLSGWTRALCGPVATDWLCQHSGTTAE